MISANGNSGVWAREQAKSGTCDADKNYRGQVSDQKNKNPNGTYGDGAKAYVSFKVGKRFVSLGSNDSWNTWRDLNEVWARRGRLRLHLCDTVDGCYSFGYANNGF